MKKIILLLVVAAMFSCSEDESPDNIVSAKRNNMDWVGQPEINIDNVTDTLTLLGIANRPNDEVIVIKIKFEGIGSYVLKNDQVYYYETVGGDVLTSEYRLAMDADGQIDITQYEQTTGLIQGVFEMSLEKERSNPDNNIDHYDFTQGAFRGEINN